MCTIIYGTLFQVRVFDYRILPNHHSDSGSILFVGSYLCRLIFPISYNFLNLLRDQENSIFIEVNLHSFLISQYIGKSVNMAPLLGEQYNRWLPMLILLLSLITFFNLHGRLLRIFGIKDIFYQPSPHDDEVVEGRRVIESARALEGRIRGRSSPAVSAHSKAREYLLGKYRATGQGSSLGQEEGLLSSKRVWAESPPASSSRVFGNAETGSSSIQSIWDNNPGFKKI